MSKIVVVGSYDSCDPDDGYVVDTKFVPDLIKALSTTGKYVAFSITSAHLALELPVEILAPYKKDFEEALMWEMYSLEAWEDDMIVHHHLTDQYDQYDNNCGLTYEDWLNWRHHLYTIEAKKLLDTLPYDDEVSTEILNIAKSLLNN